MTDLELLSNRVRTLENRYRRITALVVIAGIVIVAVGVMGQRRGVPGDIPTLSSPLGERPAIQNSAIPAEIRSQHFVLVDETGRERASLVADRAGSVFLVMFDGSGKTRSSLSVSNIGPNLTFFDPSGQTRTVLGSTALVASHVNENGIVEREPASSIVLFDRAGKLLFRTP